MDSTLTPFLLVLASCVVFLAWAADRSMNGKVRARLPAMMRKHGVEPPVILSHAQMRKAAQAARRCARCPSQRQCDEWLQDPAPKSAPLFCANLVYVDLVARATKKAMP